ncbi:Uncharacterised protein [Candidatus Burarchaeum australiense]|nr:Uncharacterised protein [Candidatus Burarchaeum australiense]
MADSKGDGVFVAAWIVIASAMLVIMKFGGLGGPDYSQFAVVLLLACGGLAYFVLKGAEEFGIGNEEGAGIACAAALAGAMFFTMLLLRGTVATSLALAIIAVCAVAMATAIVRAQRKTGAAAAVPAEKAA